VRRQSALLTLSPQFYESGCNNCESLELEGNPGRIENCTTQHFSGCAASLFGLPRLLLSSPRSTVSIFAPTESWSARWLRIERQVPGCYALAVSETISAAVIAEIEGGGD